MAVLSFAIDWRHDATAKILIENGAKLTVPEGTEPLTHLAIMRGYPMAVQAMLKRGVDINSKNQYGRTPLDIACIDWKHNKDEVSTRVLENQGGY